MSEMNTPKDLNARLRAAVKSVDVPPFLEARIRRRHEEYPQVHSPRRRWSALASAGVAAAVLAGAGLVYQLGDVRRTADEQESFIVTVSTKVATLMRVGLGDHIHCAFFRKFPKTAPTSEQMESALGQEYQDLLTVVRENVPEEFKLVLGHQCRYNGRKFVHLSLKSGSQLLSLVIAAKRDGESFDLEGMLPELVHSGIPVYSSATGPFQIAAIETSSHLVYFVSDLPGDQNTGILRAMAPSIKTILENIEG